MKKMKISAIVLMALASFTACQKESLMQPVDLNSTELADAEKATKKPYVSTISDTSGKVLQAFFYSPDAMLTDINFVDGSSEHFNYLSSGQLTSIEIFDKGGSILKTIVYQYGSNPDLPEAAQVSTIGWSGQLTPESEIKFQWDAKGKKTIEVTTMLASNTVTEQAYFYSNGNLITSEYRESGTVVASVNYSNFDTYKNPFRNVTILKLVPGFEAQLRNMQTITSVKGGMSFVEENSIAYNSNNLPSQIKTSNAMGITKHLFYSYVKL